MESIGKVFAHHLRRLRGDVKQEALAAELDIPIATYRRMESDHIPNDDKVKIVAGHFKVPVTSLYLDPDLLAKPSADQVLEIVAAALKCRPVADPGPMSKESIRRILIASFPTADQAEIDGTLLALAAPRKAKEERKHGKKG